jgi:hypothetical protein
VMCWSLCQRRRSATGHREILLQTLSACLRAEDWSSQFFYCFWSQNDEQGWYIFQITYLLRSDQDFFNGCLYKKVLDMFWQNWMFLVRKENSISE